ncbi:MAG: hypothetical protein M1438_09205 [Deltaproteobacteria bacterium]|nr:hypothetical protein [Deltaproteobacteria bacterium]
MSSIDYLEKLAVVIAGERTEWSPTVKLILAAIIALLVMSPAILGLYWEVLLPK